MKRLEGKNAIISGAASGVGRAASLLFARKGAAVACVDIDARTGAESADMVRDEGGSAVFVETDLTVLSEESRRAGNFRPPADSSRNLAGATDRLALKSWRLCR